MIKNRNIVVFAEDWGRFPSTTQHIGKELLKYNRIIWVGSLGHRKPKFSIYDLFRVLEKLLNLFKKKEVNTNKNLIVIHPFIIPLHDFNFVRKINNYLIKKKICKALQKNSFSNPILITSTPLIENILGELGESSSHYFCLDDYSKFKGAFNSLLEIENVLLKKITSVFSVSQKLLANKIPTSGNNFHLPQGVDVSHFKLIENKKNNNEEIVIGFFGLIAEWVDLELICKCAKTYPNYKFKIIGKSVTEIRCFNNYKNIDFIGEVSYRNLPENVNDFTVGLIPFKINELTLAVNPLKLIEYFAVGIPVVSTALPEVRKFGDLVFCADNEDAFISLLPNAVNDNNNFRNESRRKKAEEYSWANITEQISNAIMKTDKSH